MSDAPTNAPPADTLATPAPAFTADEIQRVVRDRYGLDGRADILTSERDQNFRFEAADGTRLVVKITNPAEDPSVTDFQTRATLHIEARDPTLPAPCLRRTLAGEPSFVVTDGGAPMVVRALTWLDGVPLHQVERTPAQRRALGATLARLGAALADFRHPAANHFLQWDVKNAPRLRPLVALIDDPARRALVTSFLDRFDAVVAPALPRLRTQVVHNDLNPFNVLVAADDHDRVTGIFDFGDMVETALVADVAVALSYQVVRAEDPLEGNVPFLAGYDAVRPLEAAEVDVLYDLIAARMVTTVTVTNWRAVRYPDNRDYILRNAPLAWDGLERFAALGPERARARLAACCSRI